MKELYLEVFSDIDEDGLCIAPLETATCLFMYRYLDSPPILLTFVVTSNSGKRATFKIRLTRILFEVVDESDVEGVASVCKLPVIVMCEGSTAVAGLCAVLRQVVKVVDKVHPLLGFKQSCLYACAESSVWTKYCEVDIVATVNDLYGSETDSKTDRVVLPVDVGRFEIHMSRPVRTHNIQKQKQDLAAKQRGRRKRCGLPDSRLDLVEELEHVFAEGPEMTLADVLLFPSFHIIFENLKSVFLRVHLPLTWKWYETMSAAARVADGLKIFAEIKKKFENEIYVSYAVPQVASQSLYQGETRRQQSKRHFFTRQKDIDESLNAVEEMKPPVELTSPTFGHDIDFDWASVPVNFRLACDQVPVKRLDRKGQQLLNMTRAVLKIARNGDRIVDFCSGSGHLGLILAHALPRCRVILLENKEQSLSRARDRANSLGLANVVFCQSNVDYFNAGFDIGVSLHACGVATDLVIERCLQENAAFVCCPCCYGSIRPNHVITYPRSELFRNSRLTLDEYLVLGHSSDQTHGEDNVKTDQGNRCMIAIDADRCLRAREAGYEVVMSKLNPPTCTPKNNLLVGIPGDRDEKQREPK